MKGFVWSVFFFALATSAVAQTTIPTADPNDELKWTHVGQDLATAQGATYRLYVDGSPLFIVAGTVTCTVSATANSTDCKTLFPSVDASGVKIPDGQHTIAVTQVLQGQYEGPKPTPLTYMWQTVVPPTPVIASNLRVIRNP